MRELTKRITLGGRLFEMKKFTAQTGSFIAYTLLTKMLPAVFAGKVEGISSSIDLPPISKQEFMEIQDTCLRSVSEIVRIDGVDVPTPVLMDDGRWGVSDLEYDAGLVFLLTTNALGFNMKSFLSESVLNDLKMLIPKDLLAE